MTGRRACLPEDCGGPWGFEKLMRALGNEKHPEHEMYREWIPVDYDPARFDLDEIDEALGAVRARSVVIADDAVRC